MKLSIIIPVFKVERYIEKCLQTVFAQDLSSDDFEVIIINDGSPDDSKKIILDFEKKHKNLIFIDQENQGVSVARNKGLEIAKGDCILFIDPDDAIVENSLSKILSRMEADNLDMLYLSLDSYNEKDTFLFSSKKNGDDQTITDGFHHERRTYPATLYKREIIGAIRFIKNITRGQDSVFNAMVQAMADKVSYCSEPYYKYTQRETSSRQYVGNEKAFLGCLSAIKELNDFRKLHFSKSTSIQNQYFDSIISVFITRALEWNILPALDKNRFLKLKEHLKQNNLTYLIDQVSADIKGFNSSFSFFKMYHKKEKIKNNLLRFLSKLKNIK